VLRIRVDWTIASELAWNGMEKTYAQLGRPKLAAADRFFLAVDHTVDPLTLLRDKRAQKLTQLSRDFAAESGIKHFYDANVTILHTKFYRDLVLPGDVVLGADSHTSSHGGLGAFAIGLGGADVTAAMVLGESWLEVPEAIAIDYLGAPPFGIGGKDIILATLGQLGRNTVAMERTVEYRGEHVRSWSTDVRFTIANMTAEFGGLNGIFEADEVVADWIARRPGDGIREGARYTQFLGELNRVIPDQRYQFDVVEANVLAHLPWLTEGGIDLKVGQYSTPLGYETIDPSTNPFYSHSYIFQFGLPFKHTGAPALHCELAVQASA